MMRDRFPFSNDPYQQFSEKQEWLIFCADCRQEFGCTDIYQPLRCGFCGGYWIAVKNVTAQDGYCCAECGKCATASERQHDRMECCNVKPVTDELYAELEVNR